MSTIHGLEEITNELLKILVQDQKFRREWERRTAQKLQQLNKDYAPVNDKIDEVTSTFEELIRVIDLATQSFLDIESSTYKFIDDSVSPDASVLFDVELQLERVDSHPTIQRLLVAARRLNQLARKFPVRLAHGCHVTNLLKFSTSVCEMLFRLEEHLGNLKGKSDVSRKLSKCASDFNRIVIETLEKWKRECEKTRKPLIDRPTTPRAKTPIRRPFSQLQRRSPGGFLMSPELAKARQLMHKRSRSSTPSKRRRSPRSLPVDPSRVETSLRRRNLGILRKRRQVAEEMEGKWGRLLEMDTASRREYCDEESGTLRVAKRISAQVIRDLRKSLGGQPLILSGQL